MYQFSKLRIDREKKLFNVFVDMLNASIFVVLTVQYIIACVYHRHELYMFVLCSVMSI